MALIDDIIRDEDYSMFEPVSTFVETDPSKQGGMPTPGGDIAGGILQGGGELLYEILNFLSSEQEPVFDEFGNKVTYQEAGMGSILKPLIKTLKPFLKKGVKSTSKAGKKVFSPKYRKAVAAEAKKETEKALNKMTKKDLVDLNVKQIHKTKEPFRKRVAQGLKDMVDPRVNPKRKALGAGLTGYQAYKDYQREALPFQENFNPMNLVLYAPFMPGLKRGQGLLGRTKIPLSSFLGGQSIISDIRKEAGWLPEVFPDELSDVIYGKVKSEDIETYKTVEDSLQKVFDKYYKENPNSEKVKQIIKNYPKYKDEYLKRQGY